MRIRHLESIFSVDKGVQVDVYPVFLADTIKACLHEFEFKSALHAN